MKSWTPRIKSNQPKKLNIYQWYYCYAAFTHSRNQLRSQEDQAHVLVIVTISKQLVYIQIWVMRTGMNLQVFVKPNLFTKDMPFNRLVIVVIDTHNTDVLSLFTTAVIDLHVVMILYYDPCYAHCTSRSKEGFHQKCWYRSGGTCCSNSEWTRLLGMFPFLPTLLFLILDLHWTGCDSTSSFHGKVKKSAWECWKAVPHVTNAFVTLTVYIYTDVPAAIWRFIWHNWTCSQTTVNVLRQCLFSWA